jgi:hypothetical protein
MKNRKRILVTGLVVVIACASAAWLAIRPRDPLFRGKPESYWIEHLSYRDEEQVKQWREFGSDGVRCSYERWTEQTDRRTDSTEMFIGRSEAFCRGV